MEDKLEHLRKVALVVGDSIRNLIRVLETFKARMSMPSNALAEYIASLGDIEDIAKAAKKIRDRKTVKAKPHRHDAKPKKGYTTINKWNRIRSNPRLR